MLSKSIPLELESDSEDYSRMPQCSILASSVLDCSRMLHYATLDRSGTPYCSVLGSCRI